MLFREEKRSGKQKMRSAYKINAQQRRKVLSREDKKTHLGRAAINMHIGETMCLWATVKLYQFYFPSVVIPIDDARPVTKKANQFQLCCKKYKVHILCICGVSIDHFTLCKTRWGSITSCLHSVHWWSFGKTKDIWRLPYCWSIRAPRWCDFARSDQKIYEQCIIS